LGFDVSNTGYFVFANATKELDRFDKKLEFKLSIVSHEGDDSWVEPTIYKIKECLDSDEIPELTPECEFCAYREAVSDVLK